MDLSRSLVVEPDKELEFRRPFTALVKQTLNVKNANPDSPLVFKVKTTAPKMYCVRPNSGKVAPNSSVEVQVLLQAMREDPPPDFKCKDKFLVQAIKVPADVLTLDGDEYTTRVGDLWAAAEQLKKSGSEDVIAEHKLRVAYLPPGEGSTTATVTNSILANPTTPSSESQPERTIPRQSSVKFKQEFNNADENLPPYTRGSVSSVASSSTAATTAPVPPATSTPAPAQQQTPAPSGTPARSTPSNFVSVVPESRSKSTTAEVDTDRQLRDSRDKIKTLEVACEGYKTEIERLKLLRQRRGDSSGKEDGGVIKGAGSPTLVLAQAQQGQLGLPLVAVIALISFVLGAVFF